MRVFDYSCLDCEHTFEEWVRDNEIVLCPSCGSPKVQVVWLTAPKFPQGFHPYNVFRNKGMEIDKSIRSVVPKAYKGSKKHG